MGRVPRSSLPDGYFHVFSRGVARTRHVFEDADDRDLFVELAWRTAKRHSWDCFALCVLGTHYHAVVEARTKELSAGLQMLSWTYARAFNAKRGSFGHVFADRYSVRAIASEEYLYEVCSYVVLNPVRAGLCDRVEEWRWSYSAYGLTAS
jgi:putative transposase